MKKTNQELNELKLATAEGVSAEEEEVDADKLMAELDRESNTRSYSGVLSQWLTRIVLVGIIGFILYCIVGFIEERARKSVFTGLIILAGYLLYPRKKGEATSLKQIPWLDGVLGLLAAAPFFYFAFSVEAFIEKATKITTFDVIVALVGIVLLFELCRRVTGVPIMVVAGAFIAYMAYHCIIERGFSLGKCLSTTVYQLFYSNVSIMGTPINACVNFIVLFILFGAFLEKTGIGTFFVDLANSIAGFSAGGPAKVAVISSALEGMYSGSSVANTVGSGSITIPVMKKAGYRPEFAAAVEAAASTGGQIMPPIMGAAAFLMAEMTGIPYPTIAVAAILPAVLYFTGIFVMVHFEAKKQGLKGLPKDTIPNFFKLILRKGYLLLPIILLVGLMSSGKTASFAACFAILAAIVVSMFDKETSIFGRSEHQSKSEKIPAKARFVNFSQAIKRYFKYGFDFHGRATRSEYWFSGLFISIIILLLGLLPIIYCVVFSNMDLLAMISSLKITLGLLSVFTIVTFVFSLSSTVRRLHDAGHSWMYLFWLLVPIVGYIMYIIVLCTHSSPDNSWGEAPVQYSDAEEMLSEESGVPTCRLIETIETGAKNAIGVSIACAMSGIVIGIVSYTGLATTLFNVIVPIARQNIFLALFLTMIACIICGMGVPTTANYILMATITAPIVIEMGVPMLAAHMFVFYFGIVADITPPVALAAYAGSAIAHSDPLKTGVNATRLAITAFVIPYIFALSPEILLVAEAGVAVTVIDVIRIVLTSVAGMIGISAGLEGYFFGNCKIWERLILIAGGLCMVIPSLLTDLLGLGLLVIGVVLQLLRNYLARKNA